MKIAFLNIYSGINNRGAESFIHELSQRLAKKHEVTIFSAGEVNLGNVKNVVINEKVYQPQQGFFSNHLQNILKRFFLDSGSLSSLAFTLKVIPYLKKENFDVVVPVNGFWQVLACKLVQLRHKFKILITGHSGPGWDERWNLFLTPDVFIATTEPTREWAKRTAFWVHSVTVPYGVDATKYETKPEKISLEKPFYLCPAAAVPYKRVDLAIKAVSKLEKGSLIHLGDGPLISEIKKSGELLLGNNRFQSLAVSHGETLKYYVACDAVVLPSSPQENSPMVFLEALAAHKPVVATDTKRNRWILGAAGFFIDPTNIKDFSEALLLAASQGAEIDFQKELVRFSWDTILPVYETILNQIRSPKSP